VSPDDPDEDESGDDTDATEGVVSPSDVVVPPTDDAPDADADESARADDDGSAPVDGSGTDATGSPVSDTGRTTTDATASSGADHEAEDGKTTDESATRSAPRRASSEETTGSGAGSDTPVDGAMGDLTPPVPEPREYVGPGLVLGLLAWAVGYGITVGLGAVLPAVGGPAFEGGPPLWQTGGWLFLSAHLAPGAVAGLTTATNVLVESGLPLLALAVVPPVPVVLAAALAVGRVGVPGPVEGLKAGTAVALGYVVPTVALGLVLEGTVLVAGTAYPLAPAPAAVVAVGVVYPVVVGGLVGAVTGR